MIYLLIFSIILVFFIMIYLKGWKNGIILTISMIIIMTLLSWLQDTLFQNSTIITIVFILLCSYLVRYIINRHKKNKS